MHLIYKYSNKSLEIVLILFIWQINTDMFSGVYGISCQFLGPDMSDKCSFHTVDQALNPIRMYLITPSNICGTSGHILPGNLYYSSGRA